MPRDLTGGDTLLGAIAGDIIGSRLEGRSDPSTGFNLFHPDCRFTDDTVCTLAVAEALRTDAGCAPTLRAFVRRYRDAGHGGMFLRWAFSGDAPAYGSWGNGAPMRGAAVGWWATTEPEAMELAAARAADNHDHPDAIAAAQVVALAILLLRPEEAAAAVRDLIAARFSGPLASGVDRTLSFGPALSTVDTSRPS